MTKLVSKRESLYCQASLRCDENPLRVFPNSDSGFQEVFRGSENYGESQFRNGVDDIKASPRFRRKTSKNTSRFSRSLKSSCPTASHCFFSSFGTGGTSRTARLPLGRSEIVAPPRVLPLQCLWSRL